MQTSRACCYCVENGFGRRCEGRHECREVFGLMGRVRGLVTWSLLASEKREIRRWENAGKELENRAQRTPATVKSLGDNEARRWKKQW